MIKGNNIIDANNIDIIKMSIDDIKRLTDKLVSTPNIYTLTGATPEIVAVTAYWITNHGQILVLWKNTGGNGWVKVEAGRDDTMAVLGTPFVGCKGPILPMGYLNAFDFTILGFNFAFARTWYCPIGATENCTANTCSAPAQYYPVSSGNPVYQYVGTDPNTPPNLVVTPGDTELRLTWNASTGGTSPGGDIFAYSILVTGDINIIGYVPYTLRDVTVTGLTNYITYSIDVRAITNSNKISLTGAAGTGRPVPACPLMGTPILTIP